MRKAFAFHGPMTPDGAPPIATRHLCYFGMGGGSVPQPPIQPMPTPPEPKVMPQADPEAQKREQIRKNAAARARKTTRASTILGDEDTFG